MGKRRDLINLYLDGYTANYVSTAKPVCEGGCSRLWSISHCNGDGTTAIGSKSPSHRGLSPFCRSVVIDIHMPRFFKEEQPDNQAHPGNHHRVPQAIEDIPCVHHQRKRHGRQEPAKPAVTDVVWQ